MEGIQWFVIGGILVAALDQIIHQSPYKSNNTVQLIMVALKAVFRVNN